MKHFLFSPRTEPGRSYPLAVWLHGGKKSSGRGSPEIPGNAFLSPDQQRCVPCFVLRPVAPRGTNWMSPREPGEKTDGVSTPMTRFLDLLENLLETRPIDRSRLVVSGASMGGFGAWDLLARRPGLFSTAIPICGGGDPSSAGLMKGTKIWAFHGAKDRVVPARASREMFRAIMKARGEKVGRNGPTRSSADGRIRHTEFPSEGHDVWDRALSDPAVVRWALE